MDTRLITGGTIRFVVGWLLVSGGVIGSALVWRALLS